MVYRSAPPHIESKTTPGLKDKIKIGARCLARRLNGETQPRCISPMQQYDPQDGKTPGFEQNPARIVLKSGEKFDVVHHFIHKTGEWVCAYEDTREDGIDYRFPCESVLYIDMTSDGDDEACPKCGARDPDEERKSSLEARKCENGHTWKQRSDGQLVVEGDAVQVASDEEADEWHVRAVYGTYVELESKYGRPRAVHIDLLKPIDRPGTKSRVATAAVSGGESR